MSQNQILFPGEQMPINENNKELKVGPGLIQKDLNSVCALKAGVFRTSSNVVYLDNSQKRYIPHLGEGVIGILVGKMGEGYKVDVGGPFPCYLDFLSFEGASKRNKPNLVVGTVVYGRISFASKDMDPEMECMGLSGKSEGFGELLGGTIIAVGLALARNLLQNGSTLLTFLSSLSSFEIAIGLNGLIWIKAETIEETIKLSNIIIKSSY